MKFKAIIFDMDGVLINSQPLHFKAEKETVAHFGGKIKDEELRQYLGWTGNAFWKEIKQKHGIIASINEIKQFKRPLYEKYLKKALKPDLRLQSLLAGLKERFKLGVASSSASREIKIVLAGLGINSYFDAVVSGEEVGRSKPAPDIFIEAAKRLGIKPGDCIVVEDAPAGIQAANAASMLSIALMTKINKGLDFSDANSVIKNLNEILRIVDA